MRVREVMAEKVVTAAPDTTFPDLVALLLEHDISGVPVVDDEGSLVGIVTEADLVTKEAYGGRRRRLLEVVADLVAGGETRWAAKSRGHRAEDVMTRRLVTAQPGEDIRVAARRMIDADVKRLPVVNNDGHLVGIVSRADLLRLLHRSDGEIRTDITAKLADPLRAPDELEVEVYVHGGIVTFTGTALHPMDVPVLDSIAWETPGVVDVHNQVIAREPDPNRASF